MDENTIIGIFGIVFVLLALRGISGTNKVIKTKGAADDTMSSVPVAAILVVVALAVAAYAIATHS